jgi:hypothetical protein
LRRFITPIGLGIRNSNSNVVGVFAQAFFEKACGQAVFQKGCDHAIARVFDKTFFEKVFDQTGLKKVESKPF